MEAGSVFASPLETIDKIWATILIWNSRGMGWWMGWDVQAWKVRWKVRFIWRKTLPKMEYGWNSIDLIALNIHHT